jgi:hypothetical protein
LNCGGARLRANTRTSVGSLALVSFNQPAYVASLGSSSAGSATVTTLATACVPAGVSTARVNRPSPALLELASVVIAYTEERHTTQPSDLTETRPNHP